MVVMCGRERERGTVVMCGRERERGGGNVWERERDGVRLMRDSASERATGERERTRQQE